MRKFWNFIRNMLFMFCLSTVMFYFIGSYASRNLNPMQWENITQINTTPSQTILFIISYLLFLIASAGAIQKSE